MSHTSKSVPLFGEHPTQLHKVSGVIKHISPSLENVTNEWSLEFIDKKRSAAIQKQHDDLVTFAGKKLTAQDAESLLVFFTHLEPNHPVPSEICGLFVPSDNYSAEKLYKSSAWSKMNWLITAKRWDIIKTILQSDNPTGRAYAVLAIQSRTKDAASAEPVLHEWIEKAIQSNDPIYVCEGGCIVQGKDTLKAFLDRREAEKNRTVEIGTKLRVD